MSSNAITLITHSHPPPPSLPLQQEVLKQKLQPPGGKQQQQQDDEVGGMPGEKPLARVEAGLEAKSLFGRPPCSCTLTIARPKPLEYA